MFRVSFFCDDKKLSHALHALLGLAHGSPEVQPVVNAVQSANGLVAATAGGAVERLIPHLKKLKGTDISAAKDGAGLAKAVGINPSSAGYMLRKAREAGLLKQSGSGSGTKYRVL
jgi:hypothetical protein